MPINLRKTVSDGTFHPRVVLPGNLNEWRKTKCH